MNFQSFLVIATAGLSALYFIQRVLGELGVGVKAAGSSCHGCNPTGCPAARRE